MKFVESFSLFNIHKNQTELKLQQQRVAITNVSTCFYFTCKYSNILHLFDIQPFFNTNRTDVEGDENKICQIADIKSQKSRFYFENTYLQPSIFKYFRKRKFTFLSCCLSG